MIREKIVVVGAGGHAQSCIDVIESQGVYEIAGLVGKVSEIGNRVHGYEVIGCDEDLPLFASRFTNAIVGVGQINSANPRAKIFQELKLYGFYLPTVISPHAYVSDTVSIGSGSIVMHHALINAGAKIGENCIINSKALIEHNTVIEDNVHVATGAVVNGECIIGEGTFIGSGSVIKQGCKIGSESAIGMQLGVRSDLPPKSLYTNGQKL